RAAPATGHFGLPGHTRLHRLGGRAARRHSARCAGYRRTYPADAGPGRAQSLFSDCNAWRGGRFARRDRPAFGRARQRNRAMNTQLAPSALTVHGQWLAAARSRLRQGEPLVLITVARALGSTPRDAGTRMWVDADGAHATIGGGHLELQAIEVARAMLADAGAPSTQVRHYALGPSLGQCCGGAVWLAFERLEPQDLAWCDALHQVLERGAAGRRVRRCSARQAPGGGAHAPDVRVEAVDSLAVAQPDARWHEEDELLVDLTPAAAPLVVVCG